MKRKVVGVILGLTMALAFPTLVSAHHLNGSPVVNCVAKTIVVNVASWSGNVELTNTTTKNVFEAAPSGPNGIAVFALGTVGGNGTYTVGRQYNPTDPYPTTFTVNCPVATPTPTPTPPPTPTSTPTPVPSTPTPRPTSTPTGGLVPPITTNIPTPDTGAGIAQDTADTIIGVMLLGLGLVLVIMLTYMFIRRKP